jgi:hypothetical protein
MVDLLKKQRVEVRTEGELVVLAVGNAELKMDYETAIQVSTWLRVRGKEAKRNAGDVSRHWTVIGRLDDVTAGGRPW